MATRHDGMQTLQADENGAKYHLRRYYRFTGASPWWRRHYTGGNVQWLDAGETMPSRLYDETEGRHRDPVQELFAADASLRSQ